MSDQSKLGLGQIITTPQQRDAIHVAVAPVMAHERLVPGDHVGINSAGEATEGAPHIGVVDPFIKAKSIKAGESFWLFLYPGSITSLRHEWTHAAFSLEPVQDIKGTQENEARKWMQKWCAQNAQHGYGEPLTVEMAIRFGENMNVGCFEDVRENIDDVWWRHWEALTGQSSEAKRDEYFSCSC